VKLDIVIDVSTGESWYEGKHGQRFSHDEVAAAMAGAERGDPEAQAKLALIDARPEGAPPITAGMSTEEMLRRMMDDCPDCQAALARGEQPIVYQGEELQRLLATYSPPARDPSWWMGRKGRRRARHRGRK
jgi:hypothetical protein